LEETRNRTAWDNQLKGYITERRKRRHGKWNRKSTAKKLITYFLYRLQAPWDLSSDKDAHLNRSTIIFAIGLLHTWKPKQDSPTRPTKPHQGQETQQTWKGEGKRSRTGEHKPKEQKTESRKTTRQRPERRLQKCKMVHPSTPPPHSPPPKTKYVVVVLKPPSNKH
jgi:hypothetical protein